MPHFCVVMNHASIKKYLALLAFYFFLALVLTYPLALHLNTHIPGHDTDGPAQTWSLWWTRYALLDLGRAPFTTDYLFYPLGINLVAYTPVFLNGILSIPLQYVFGEIVAQNLMVYFALVSGAFGAYLFTREFLKQNNSQSLRYVEFAAAMAGALYGFGAWHLNYVVAGHFMLISNQWLPYYALFLLRLPRGKMRDALLLSVFLILTAWTELTYVPFLALLTIFYLVYLALVQRENFFATIQKLVVTSLFAAIGIVPLVLSLAFDFQRYGNYLAAGVGRIQIFSAEPISFFLPSGQHPLLGAWAESITRANTSYAFVGWAVLALVGIGLYVKRKTPFAWFWAVCAFLFALLMFGTTLYVNGENTNVPMPFALLRMIPFVNANRYPARFNVMLMLSVLPLFAWGVRALWTREIASSQSARLAMTKRVALFVLLCVLAFEQLVLPIPLTKIQAPKIFETIRAERGDFSILELPLGWRGSIVMQGETDDVAQFFQTVDHKRRLGGITSRFPDFKLRYFDYAPVLRTLIAFEEKRAVDETQLVQDRAEIENVLRFFDIRYVSLYKPQIAPETWAFVQENFPLQEIFSDAERAVYRVNLSPPPAQVEINPASDVARLLFDDAWGGAQEDDAGSGYRWALDENARVWLPLENADYEITFRLRGARPNQTVRLRVNENDVTEWNVSDAWGEYRANIPRSVLRDGLDEIVFVTETTPLGNAASDNRTIGNTGIVSPVDISATGAGFDAGRFGEIFVAGQNVIPNTRGYHLVAINAQTGKIDASGSFDTFADVNASARLRAFVEKLPQGEIVAGVAIDEASQKLNEDAFAALQSLGVIGDVRAQFRAGHAFVGIKGIEMGLAVEDMTANLPATVTIGKNVTRPRVAFALGIFNILKK